MCSLISGGEGILIAAVGLLVVGLAAGCLPIQRLDGGRRAGQRVPVPVPAKVSRLRLLRGLDVLGDVVLTLSREVHVVGAGDVLEDAAGNDLPELLEQGAG